MSDYHDIDILLEDYYRRRRLRPQPWWRAGRFMALFWTVAVVLTILLALAVLRAGAEEHCFWDKRNVAGLAVHGAARGFDAYTSCRIYARGIREGRVRFVESCPGIVVYSTGVTGVELGLRYWLHRRGKHKLERWLPYTFAAPAAIEAGFNYRF